MAQSKGMTCTNCGKYFPEPSEGFYLRKDSGKYRTQCIDCTLEKNRRNKAENKEDRLAYSRRYYWENRDEVLARVRNTDRSEYQRRYDRDNRDEILVNDHRRRSHITGVEFEYSLEEWLDAKRYFGGRCAYCGGESLDEVITIDHFIPYSKGGGTTRKNIIPSCWECNRYKSSKDFEVWYPEWDYYNEERRKVILEFTNNKRNEDEH